MSDLGVEYVQQQQIRRRAKRQKVAHACIECRSRKIKCDGERPACGPCVKRHGDDANCNLHLSTDQELTLFREEIARLNDKLQDLKNQKEDSITGGEVLVHRLNRLLATQSEPNSPSSSTQEDVDPMVGEVSYRSPAGQPFFGTSSTSGFVRQVEHALDPENLIEATTSTAGHETDSKLVNPYQATSESFKSDAIKLPPRLTADRLLDIYWSITYPLYPFLDQEDTKDEYLGLWQSDTSVPIQRSFLCQINMIFAMAAQLDETVAPQNRATISRVYLVLAKRQLASELWEHASIRAVQNFLILAQYLQSTTKGYQCWMATGHAIRMAQNLGLHFRETSERIDSPRKQQLYRKVWHGCVMMDRIVSLTFGRPTMIDGQAASIVPMPLNKDDVDLTHETVLDAAQDNCRPTMTDFYIEALKLYEILHKVLERLYHSTEELGYIGSLSASFLNSERLAVLLDLDQHLLTWFDNLPTHLRTDHEQCSRSIFVRQANILYIRYLHVRILLYRPSLARFIATHNTAQSDQTKKQATLYEALLLRSSTLCVQAAISAIETIDMYLPESVATIGLLPAWWYNVLYVYTAAIVLLAAAHCPTLQSEVGQRLILSKFETAILIVRRYKIYSSTVQKSVAVLEALYAKLSDQRSTAHVTGNDRSNVDCGVGSISTAYTDGLQSQLIPQYEQYGSLPQQEFQRYSGHQPTGVESPSSAYNPTIAPSFIEHQPQDIQIDTDFNSTYLDMSLDTDDFSWLNSLPFSV